MNKDLETILKEKEYIIDIIQYLLLNNFNFTSEVNDEEATIEIFNICKLCFFYEYEKGFDYKLTKYTSL